MRTARDLSDERIMAPIVSHLQGLLEAPDPITHAGELLKPLEARDAGPAGELSKVEKAYLGVVDHRQRLAKSDLDPRERRRLDETLAKAQRSLGEELAMKASQGHRTNREVRRLRKEAGWGRARGVAA